MLKRIISLLFCASATLSLAQSLSVTATITDSDTIVWANGTGSVQLISPNGPPFYNGSAVSTVQQNFTLNGSGALAVTLNNTSTITPIGATYRWTLCSKTSAPCSQFNSPVTAANQTSTLSALVTVPRFSSGANSYGYADGEVIVTPTPGQVYYNVVNSVQRIWSGSAWANNGGGGGGGATIAATNLVIKGDGAGNGIVATGRDEALTATLGTSGNIFLGTTNPPNIGNNNVVLGFGAGAALTFTPNTATTSAYENVMIGYLAGQHVTTQNFDVLIGSQAGASLTGTGAPVEDGINTCVGAGACQVLTTGGDNVYVGEDAGSGNAGASSGNTVLGTHAGDNITTLNSSVLIGHSAMGTTGTSITVSNNVVIGDGAASNASGNNSDNVIIGHQGANNFTTGIQDVYIGSAVAPQVTSGNHNVVMGYDAAPNLTTGSDNTIIGFQAMNAQGASSGSIAIGSLANSDTGSDNVEMGSFSGGGATQADQVCIGLFSCNNMTGGSNTAVGIQANATSAGTGHNNVLLGRLAQVAPNVNSAGQIGVGTNSTSSTLQFLSTTIINASGFIPVGTLGSGTAAAGKYVDGASGVWTTLPNMIANTTTTYTSHTLTANTCDASATTVTMTGVTTASTFQFTSTVDDTGFTGWGSSGGLKINAWPTSNTLNYKVCNQTNASITSTSDTWNVSAR